MGKENAKHFHTVYTDQQAKPGGQGNLEERQLNPRRRQWYTVMQTDMEGKVHRYATEEEEEQATSKLQPTTRG